MYHNNEDEKREYPYSNNPSDMPPYNAAPTNENIYSAQAPTDPVIPVAPIYTPDPMIPIAPEAPATPIYSEPIYTEPVHVEPIYSAPVNNEPVYNGQAYSEPTVYSEPPVYNREPAYGEQHVNNDSIYSEPREVPWNMYSPGICVNQPFPRARANESGRVKAPRERNRRLGGFLRAVCLVLVCSLFSGAAAYTVMDYRFNRGDFALNNQVILGGPIADNRQDDLLAPIAPLTNEITAQDIYDKARTQVVGIVTEAPSIFGIPEIQGDAAPITGSGFIISNDGYILTNYHVIEIAHVNGLPISVVMADGTTYDAQVVGFEANNDVAVIKIDAAGLNPALIGNSDHIRVGQRVYAVGNPFGDLVYTMTDGIVSALDRVVSVEGKSISTFQFSAAVNRGNSGGPIYNANGEVLGIVTAKVVRGNVEGIGFAIPINDAIEIATELIEHGYISGRPLIGITGQTVTLGHAEYYGWVVGSYIRSVAPGSAAETAGIQVGDIITALDDVEVASMEELRFILRNYRAGETAIITVWRNGEVIELSIVFDEDMYAGQPDGRPILEPETPDPFENMP